MVLSVSVVSCENPPKPPSPYDVAGIKLDKESLVLEVGVEEKLTATIVPPTAKNKTVIWLSRNEDIATVGNFGEVIALREGDAIIIAIASNGDMSSCTVRVKRKVIEPTGISLNSSTLFMDLAKAERTYNLLATIEPYDAENKTISWSSSNNLVATVDSNGRITVNRELGEAIITATTINGKTATCLVSVDMNLSHKPDVPPVVILPWPIELQN